MARLFEVELHKVSGCWAFDEVGLMFSHKSLRQNFDVPNHKMRLTVAVYDKPARNRVKAVVQRDSISPYLTLKNVVGCIGHLVDHPLYAFQIAGLLFIHGLDKTGTTLYLELYYV
jgi:hypothetical protein